ncbi:hypothetical protein BT93_C2028 [Corymbia citriodora subsp. variegata]|nr:hypothetical protein BT93_C2028 [Corymbia citriodora subsp. variegata]
MYKKRRPMRTEHNFYFNQVKYFSASDFYMLAKRHSKESSMDSQDSSILERSAGISEEQVDEPYYRPLVRAAFKGDWEFATTFFERDSASKTAKITNRSETLLHIAALGAHDQFLENLVELFSPYPEALEMVDRDGRTALHNAVLCGRIRMVKALVRSNPKLTQLADNEDRVPLGMSALEASKHKEIAWFLAKNTTDDGPSHPFSCSSSISTIIDLTYSGHLGKIFIALYLNSICFFTSF